MAALNTARKGHLTTAEALIATAIAIALSMVRIENGCVALTGFLLLQRGNTSLHLASSLGRTELCELLLKAKADVEAKDKVL